MKNEQEEKRGLVDQLLDGEIDGEQRQALMELIGSDAALKEDYDRTARALDAVRTGDRVPASAFFTQEVMRRLPQAKPGLRKRIGQFLFRGRQLRWNMATALAMLMIAALAFTIALRDKGTTRDTALQQGEDRVIVTMNLYAPEADRVTVAGTFNKWKTDANALRKGENGYWTISLPLQPGDYTYMFVVDGRAWVTDPNAQTYRDDGFGNKNAVLRVKT
jgi:anti-sigma factor RsiW